MKTSLLTLLLILTLLYGCNETSKSEILEENLTENSFSQNIMPLQNITPLQIDFKKTISLNNKAAYITAQCYTKTLDENLTAHNPCFACHINSNEPNYVDDAELQATYDMREYTKVNRFTNLFKDRTEYVNAMSDEKILNYVREENYLALSEKLARVPNLWDANSDGVWNGYIPDCNFDFDEDGFDKDINSSYSGWRAFAYYPFLGTFWPTNGSFDDVMIRLPKEFREDNSSNFNLEVYKINLAIVEAMIKRQDVEIEEVNENIYGVDLNKDGILNIANKIKYEWQTPSYDSSTKLIKDFSMEYVGMARELLKSNAYLIAPGLYPKGTEFLHSVRYIDVVDETITMASRMKELRYAKKESWNNYAQMQNASMAEIMEKDQFPDRLRKIKGDSEKGLLTGLGWRYQGFIEDENGELRPQNYEETQYCIGCHSGIGAISDSTFVFQRKFDHGSKQGGWYHWSQDSNGLKNVKEPLTKDGRYEYTLYLEKNGAGDEFRDNDEVMKEYFENTLLKDEKVQELHSDISQLLIPSKERALRLNKAYKIIVEEQSFIYGREAHIKPVQNVYQEVLEAQSTYNEIITQ